MLQFGVRNFLVMTESFGLSDTGRVRPTNQDCYLLIPELGLYLLADGMGGARGGERASKIAVKTAAEWVRQSSRHDPDILHEAMCKANEEVLRAATNDPRLHGMGTTLLVALDLGEEIAISSVGDSRAYMLEDGSLRALTQDQSWVNEIGRTLGLNEAILQRHPLRNVLTMAIGAGERLVVNSYAVPWKPGALVLLSSDGLHGVIQRDEIEELLNAGSPSELLETKCRRLIKAALDAGAPDNVTAVLLRCVA